jgi:uncharacterized repeat protein (TIGR01451 family)
MERVGNWSNGVVALVATRHGRRWATVVLAAIAALGMTATPANAVDIADAGSPLTSIGITPDLNCSVNHAGDAQPEFFQGTACATLIASGGTLYGPATIPAGTNAAPRTTLTAVSQSAATGSGTAASPRGVTTNVAAGTLTVTQTDSYIFGQEAYRTDVTVTNTGATTANAIIYRAGDCFLQDSDTGLGTVGPAAGAVACKSTTSERLEQWLPITAGSHYMEGFYADVWARIGAQQPFDDTCQCATALDNGAGLSWSVALPAGASTTVSHLTSFSPDGLQPLDTTKTADAATVTSGGNDGYTITLTNPNTTAASVTAITDTLPAGFAYRTATTTGVTTDEPVVSGQALRWPGPFTVPAASSVTLHFGVTAATAPGTYFNNAGGEAGALAVTPTGPSAPVTVENAVLCQNNIACAAGASVTGFVPGSNPPVSYTNNVTITSAVNPDNAGVPNDGGVLRIAYNTGPNISCAGYTPASPDREVFAGPNRPKQITSRIDAALLRAQNKKATALRTCFLSPVPFSLGFLKPKAPNVGDVDGDGSPNYLGLLPQCLDWFTYKGHTFLVGPPCQVSAKADGQGNGVVIYKIPASDKDPTGRH